MTGHGARLAVGIGRRAVGMLASKEVAFIYIALFGSFMTLFWAMRLLQDIGVQRRPAQDGRWHAPRSRWSWDTSSCSGWCW